MGLGDAIMATGEINELIKEHPDTKFLIGDGTNEYWNEVFLNNPYIIRKSEANNHKKILWLNNYEGHRPYRNYDKKKLADNYNWNINYKVKKGEFFFSDDEIKLATDVISKIKNKVGSKKIIFIEPYVKKRRGYQNRDWGFENWEKVVYDLKDRYAFLHLTYGDLVPIKNCINIHGLNFRSSVAILSKCDLFIGTEGGMHHAAAATSRKGVVIFGGHISPQTTGYDFHKNLYADIEGSPCGNKNICDHCKKSMEIISKDNVINEINNILKVN